MKLLCCERCGGNDLKNTGLNTLVCSFCGSKYILDNKESVVSKEVTSIRVCNLIEQSVKCYNNNEHQKSLELLLEALEYEPENETLWIKLGRSYRILGFHDRALNAYENAKKINPDDPTIYTNTGTIHIVNKNYKAACECYSKAMTLIENGSFITENDRAIAYGNYAIAVSLNGDKRYGEKLMRMAEKLGYENSKRARQMAGLRRRFFS